MSDLMLCNVFLLIKSTGLTGKAGYFASNPEEWQFYANEGMRHFRRVRTIEDYLQTHQKQIERWPPRLPLFGFASNVQEASIPSTGASKEQQRADGGYEFDVAISFAGPQRNQAERLAELIKDAGFSVFYDDYYPEDLWGKDLPTFFRDIYENKSLYCVMFVSQEYVDRMWTTWERRSATTRMLKERGGEYILPIKVEQIDVPEIPVTLGHLSVDQYPIEDIAKILIRKRRKRKVSSSAGLD